VDEWFIRNVAEIQALRNPKSGTAIRFEDPNDPFPELGVSIRILDPGQPNGRYHSENQQEDFLVLAGEPTVLIDGEERQLRPWDFVHCPPGVNHIFVGAGEGPSAILMMGARKPEGEEKLHYPVSEMAARYDASAKQDTDEPEVAYSDWQRVFEPVDIDWPPA
jgi:uncharacterized cupin superfamily protein